MGFDGLVLPSLILFGITALILFFIQDWRVIITALGFQYIGVFILVGLTWPLEMAIIKLITGWIASALLGMGLVSLPPEKNPPQHAPISGQFFRLILVIVVGLAAISFGPQIAKWLLQAAYGQILGGLLLIGMGLLHLSFSAKPFRVTIGLLTIFSGFEIIYATLDASPLAAGLLSVINLGMALTGAYLIVAPTVKENG